MSTLADIFSFNLTEYTLFLLYNCFYVFLSKLKHTRHEVSLWLKGSMIQIHRKILHNSLSVYISHTIVLINFIFLTCVYCHEIGSRLYFFTVELWQDLIWTYCTVYYLILLIVDCYLYKFYKYLFFKLFCD